MAAIMKLQVRITKYLMCIYGHMYTKYVHIYTKYEVSMSNPVPGGGVHNDANNANDANADANDGQSMIV